LTPFSLERKEVRKDTLNKSERKTEVGTQSVDVSCWFISEVGNGMQPHPKTQTQGERRVNIWWEDNLTTTENKERRSRVRFRRRRDLPYESG